ncbi:SDR family NAD(P)-dependent oxidoreductase [Sphingomonas sp. PP-CC-3G-468]|uniref:SDR family NAD(P)-dependent oxidoreductase n=1 Tax=Sphingomonas sp. PP-CC-3G-468 TaxID=2135656 RepID=UPI0010518813|nr:SDR family NAD(P)-dependent oxidoreductase [Sphingomonas sp. PP-CC-3G-468]TCM00435.1 NADP-dependent 3-hydroxy acid dehydrogenase YdfG [Sphingomonas sp. PP-CC-3G-468]
MPLPEQSKTWFVTGSSRGFGRHWVEAALARGDRVAATARDVADLADLVERYPQTVVALPLDVTDRAAVFAAVEEARARLGRIDVVVSNAGYGLFGAIEEVSEADARKQIDTNIFGAISLIQAAMPILRAQGSGHILITSSFGGLMNFATAGLYGATKFALEAIGEALALETQDFGIKVTLIEPAAYDTDFNGSSSASADQISAYDKARKRTMKVFEQMPPGDPRHTSDAILQLADMDQPPLRILLGQYALPMVRKAYAEKLDTWERWSSLSDTAQ